MPALRRLGVAIGWAAYGLLLLLGGITGCNLFQPRNPQPPTEGGVSSDYSLPDSSLATMARAIEAKAGSNSLTAYHDALADSLVNGDSQGFLAFFDPAALAVWQAATSGTPPAVWVRKQEDQLFSYLASLRLNNPYVFAWLTDVDHPHDEDIPPSTKLLHRQYLLLAVSGGAAAADTLAIGYADLTFIKSATDKWVIARWQDRVDPAVGANPIKGKQSFSRIRLDTGASP